MMRSKSQYLRFLISDSYMYLHTYQPGMYMYLMYISILKGIYFHSSFVHSFSAI